MSDYGCFRKWRRAGEIIYFKVHHGVYNHIDKNGYSYMFVSVYIYISLCECACGLM